MEFFETIRLVKQNWQPYKVWDLEQQKKEKQNEELRKKYPPSPNEIEHAKQYGRTVVETINTMDQHSIDKAEDTKFIVQNAIMLSKYMAIGLGLLSGSLSMLSKKVQKNEALVLYYQAIGVILGAMGTSIAGEILASSTEKQASRIARFQTRENDLKDPRNFVVYSEKQIEEAKQIAKSMPEINDKKHNLTMKESLNPIKTFKNAKNTVDSLRKDYNEYKKWKEKYLKDENDKKIKLQQAKFSQNDLSKAQKSRDNILNTIRKIEYSSLNYLMNMRLALYSIVAALLAAGVSCGIGAVKLIDYLHKNKKIKFNSTALNISKLGGVKFVPVIPLILTIGPMVKLAKDAARVGRYKAKQELLSSPQNFIAYSDEERKRVKKTSETQKTRQNNNGMLKDSFQTIKQLKKDYQEYNNYMKTKHKEELKLDEALKQVKITPEQLIEAKKLQKQVFHAFEKMDEKAQRFTDDTEAAVDICTKLVGITLSGIVRIISISYALKKLKQYNKNEILKLKDIKKAFKKFNSGDILKTILPLFAPMLISTPLIIKGIHIKKEAGKIGVMTAMQDLEDPKNFIDDAELKNKTNVN